jgi:hypothetical protein
MHSILEKVNSKKKESFSSIVGVRELYSITNNLYEDNPEFDGRQSKGHKYSLGANIFDVFPELFTDICNGDESKYAKVFGRYNNQRCYKWINRSYISQPDNFNSYKLIISKADGAAGKVGSPIPARIIGKTEIGEPAVAYTDTFIGIGCFSSLYEAESCQKYVMTKFARTMLGTLKVTQDNPKETWANVPMQDFTPKSDIDWNKSVHEIDIQLYNKYNLTDKERRFIESMIATME